MPIDSEKLRRRRERLKLTQTQAAERAGMSQAHWSLIESGKRDDPQLSIAQRIAAALGVALTSIVR